MSLILGVILAGALQNATTSDAQNSYNPSKSIEVLDQAAKAGKLTLFDSSARKPNTKILGINVFDCRADFITQYDYGYTRLKEFEFTADSSIKVLSGGMIELAHSSGVSRSLMILSNPKDQNVYLALLYIKENCGLGVSIF